MSTFAGLRIDPAGRIVSRVSFPGTDLLVNRARLKPGWRVEPWPEIEGFDPALYWFDGAAFLPRPLVLAETSLALPADGVSVLSIDLPPASLVVHVEARATVDVSDGSFEFVTAIAGTYTFQVQPPFPALRQVLTVTAHAL